MNRIKVLIYFIFLFTVTSLSGQGSDSLGITLGYPVYSQYLQNGLVINPAYTGSRGALSALISYRKQWIDTKGSPVIQSVSLHTPMKNDKVALGILAQFMQFGFTKSHSVYVSYAYNIRVAKGKLSFGLKGGFDRSNTDYSKLILTQAGDPVFSSDNNKPFLLPNVGAGVYYYGDKLFAGLAVPSFLSYRRPSLGADPQAYHDFNTYDYVFSAGGLITFTEAFKFKPSVLIDYSMREPGKLTQFDINGNFILGDLVWIGGSWRTSEQVAVGILQLQLNPQIMFGCSYDYPFGRLTPYSTGSAEFILRYEFGSKVSAANPKYF